MPANTAHGFPYPLGTDPISDGDDQIKALAEAVDLAVYSAPFWKGYQAAGILMATNTTILWTQSENIGGGTYTAGLYTVPKAGIYRLVMAVKFNNGTAGSPPVIGFSKNAAYSYIGFNTASAQYAGASATWDGRFIVGDKISASLLNAGGTVMNDAPAENTFMTIQYLRA